jgi:GT2 family glycosyltransferase
MYSEDIDLAYRAARRGRPAMLTPAATAMHVGGASSRSSADKMVLVLTGKATYVRKHWSPIARRFGLMMLWAGAALRAALHRGGRRRDPAGPDWSAVWRARRRWLAGYPTARERPAARHDASHRRDG